VHTHACARFCVCAKTTRSRSRRNGPFDLFTQLSSGDFTVGVTLPPILTLLRSCLSFGLGFPCHDSLRPPELECFLEPGQEGYKLESILVPFWLPIPICQLDVLPTS
jgi:hypothetical protein